MNARAHIETPAASLRRIVAEIVATSDTREEAAAALLRRVRGDAALWAALMEPHEKMAADAAVRGMVHEQRRRIWARPVEPDARVAALANMHATLMDFRLPSGLRLRDATAADCMDGATFYARQAGDMAWKARWLSAVAEACGDGVVADAMDERALAALREKTHDI